MPRPSVILGTSNDSEFLTDPTGNRRWWIINVNQKIPVDQVKIERDRIWAAAVSLYKGGETWWLDAEQERAADLIRREFEHTDAWTEPIENYIGVNTEVSVAEIFSHCLLIDLALQDNSKKNRVTSILKRLGFLPASNPVWRGGKKIRVWEKKYFENLPLQGNAVPRGVPAVPEAQDPPVQGVSTGTPLGTPLGTPPTTAVPEASPGTAVGTAGAVECYAVPRGVPEETRSGQSLQPLGTVGTAGTAFSLRRENALHEDTGSTATYGGADIPTARILRDYRLTITAVDGAIATVTAPELSHPVEVPYADLEIDF